nr:hypothetical protein [Tanacetum cinerariifolium]
SVHTEDETMANEVQEQSMQIGEGIGRGLDSQRYQLGPQTQEIVFETTDKQYKESEQVTKTYEKGVEAFSSRKSESSPTNEVMVRGRRAVTLTDRMKSPFYVRVVNVDKVENSKEKRLANILFKKRDGDDRGKTMLAKSDILFILVSNVQQKFLLCINLKNSAVTLIDSKKEGNKVTRKKKKDDDIDDMRVA